MKNLVTSNSDVYPKFKESVYIDPFLAHLKTMCQDISDGDFIEVYRTQHIIPVDEYGQTPNALRARKGIGKKVSRKYSEEEVSALTPDQKSNVIGKYGLSCNSSEEAAEISFLDGYRKLKQRGATEKELEEYAIRRGEYICKYIISNDVGWITEFTHNHANLYLYQGVDLEDCRDKTYQPRKIDYQNYE